MGLLKINKTIIIIIIKEKKSQLRSVKITLMDQQREPCTYKTTDPPEIQ